MTHAVVDASAFVCALTDATATDLRGVPCHSICPIDI